MPHRRRLTIATKLLVWSGTLIIVFFATTAFLFKQVRNDAEVSSRIVAVNHDLDSAIQRMLERLYAVQDNIRRYKVLGNEEVVSFIVEDLDRFGEILKATLKKHPSYRYDWQDLTKEYELTIDPEDSPRETLAPDTTIKDWTDILEQSLLENQADMELSLTHLHEAGETASNWGLYGLILCLAMGVGGSLALAYSLNRSLKEIRSGIRELGTGSTPRDVRVLSGDELGELAQAFNRMAGRLRREEQMRADFIAMLSHEIRTPLTSIRESVDLIGSGAFGEVNEKQERFLSIAEKESVRLSDLLTRLMTVSRMESKSLDLNLEEVECVRLVDSALERIAPAAQAKGITLNAEPIEGTPTCQCDSGHIRQVLLNLVGNAIKFSPEGSTVSVAAKVDGDRMIFSVTDNGPGISEDEQGRIFQKYYRDPSVRESVDGAGLGLAIARRIVQGHGGEIQVASSPGQGATFSFSIPAKDEQ
ncbi:HAMP domain-containing sensor histidine kinase [Pseudodesulfovibrio sp. zrk46]|uniref:sensor histidine kinase n=1 Tax=Pseudodesulfovibrio sp. zrk46 TaxID=2725288 RepID=UPI0014495BFB|nr:HAMP domain-containing sensor histidine kinase [Pseudodesulfovibrio sp. zrk46]QJB55295.1 HAMP domain-containing histidine kinase [Pseudodesulfovibrio sp. zrk46]